MLPSEMKTIARRFVEEAWGKGNLKVLDDVCAPNYAIGEGGNLQTLKDAIVETRKGVPDLKGEVREMVAEGDWVAYRWSMTGIHKGVYEGIAPTGKPVKFTGISMLRFANGKIVEDIFEIGSKDFREQVAHPAHQ
jgi:predicted ester cyclase